MNIALPTRSWSPPMVNKPWIICTTVANSCGVPPRTRGPSSRSKTAEDRRARDSATDQERRETEDDSGGCAHIIPRRKGYGGQLQIGRQCLCGKASGFPRIRECNQGTRGFLGCYQRASGGERQKALKRP